MMLSKVTAARLQCAVRQRSEEMASQKLQRNMVKTPSRSGFSLFPLTTARLRCAVGQRIEEVSLNTSYEKDFS